MKKLSPLYSTKEYQKIIDSNPEKVDIRIGFFFSKLPTYQKQRFNRIVTSIARKLNVALNQCQIEIILIRQIALDTIKIDEAELFLINNPESKWVSQTEEFLFKAKKERREAIKDLCTVMQIQGKKSGLDNFGELRDSLREAENLDKGKELIMPKDGHDRRHYDPILRTK